MFAAVIASSETATAYTQDASYLGNSCDKLKTLEVTPQVSIWQVNSTGALYVTVQNTWSDQAIYYFSLSVSCVDSHGNLITQDFLERERDSSVLGAGMTKKFEVMLNTKDKVNSCRAALHDCALLGLE